MNKINLEETFVSLLKGSDRCIWFLENNINMVEYFDNIKPEIMTILGVSFALIPKKKKLEMVGDVDVHRILRILRRERIDLFKILNTNEGVKWLDDQIYFFKSRFL